MVCKIHVTTITYPWYSPNLFRSISAISPNVAYASTQHKIWGIKLVTVPLASCRFLMADEKISLFRVALTWAIFFALLNPNTIVYFEGWHRFCFIRSKSIYTHHNLLTIFD